MALQGTIKDFGLPDILQLIGIQRKTGVLTLDNDEDTVSVSFLEGQVVAADTRLRNLEDLLGSVLVRTGRITEDQLRQALRTQKKTLQRLGYILVNSQFISEKELAEALRIQVTQIVYRLFRWRAGKYRFLPSEEVEYDREHFTPIAAETILMEGARMIDEWPIIERRIKSDRMVFRKTEAGAQLEAPVESIVDEHVDLDFGFGAAGTESKGQEPEITLSREEREILRMVDGKAPVQDLVDGSSLGEFDTYRILYELLTRHLIEEVKASPLTEATTQVSHAKRLVGALLPIALAAASLLAVGTLSTNPLTPWNLGDAYHVTDRLRGYASRIRLERIEKAIRLFYLETGSMPTRLEMLVGSGYLEDGALADPAGRPYAYQLAGGSFRLSGLDAAGSTDPDLVITRRFSSSQRMMLEGVPGGP